jgi:hypothetical protein
LSKVLKKPFLCILSNCQKNHILFGRGPAPAFAPLPVSFRPALTGFAVLFSGSSLLVFSRFFLYLSHFLASFLFAFSRFSLLCLSLPPGCCLPFHPPGSGRFPPLFTAFQRPSPRVAGKELTAFLCTPNKIESFPASFRKFVAVIPVKISMPS